MHLPSLFSLSDHLQRLSKDGDPLEILEGTVDFEQFRDLLTSGLGYSDGKKGGRPPFDPVSMFKVLVVQAQHNLSDARMEFMIRDRLSWMRFFGFDLGGAMPDENTIRHYRNRLSESGTLGALMEAFDQQLHEQGYLAMGGQIVDATLVPAPKQRNTEDEKSAVKAGRSAKQIWRGKPMPEHTARANAVRSVTDQTEPRFRRSQRRCSVTRTISASTGAMALSGKPKQPRRPTATEGNCAM